MNPIKITAKSQELDNDHAQWSLSLAENECATLMCDTIHRPAAPSITVYAELAAIWTACKQIKGYRWILVHCSRETERHQSVRDTPKVNNVPTSWISRKTIKKSYRYW